MFATQIHVKLTVMLCNFSISYFFLPDSVVLNDYNPREKNIHKIINERTKRSNRRAESPILSIMFDWHWYASVVKALRSHYGHKSYHTTWMAPAAIIILHFMPRYTKIWIIINLDLSLEPLLFFFLLQWKFLVFHCCQCMLIFFSFLFPFLSSIDCLQKKR